MENLVRYCIKSVLSQIRHHVSLFGSGNGTGTAQDWDFCTSSAPCTHGHGDCDGDDECAEHHLCGEDNCRHFWTQAEALADCCVPGGVRLFWIFLAVFSFALSEVQLVGGSGPHEGNIFVGGKPVCDDDHDVENALVVCRYLVVFEISREISKTSSSSCQKIEFVKNHTTYYK